MDRCETPRIRMFTRMSVLSAHWRNLTPSIVIVSTNQITLTPLHWMIKSCSFINVFELTSHHNHSGKMRSKHISHNRHTRQSIRPAIRQTTRVTQKDLSSKSLSGNRVGTPSLNSHRFVLFLSSLLFSSFCSPLLWSPCPPSFFFPPFSQMLWKFSTSCSIFLWRDSIDLSAP